MQTAENVSEYKAEVSVSIVIPCRNEAKYIARCLDSIIDNGYPHALLEILVMDGLSDDGTREILSDYVKRYKFIRMIDNPRRAVPAALNIGIRASVGEVILRLDGHTLLGKGYIILCVSSLRKYNVANVGGIIKTMPGRETLIAKAIAYALSHPFGVGRSHFRLERSKICFVDTVPFGCYRRELFETIGYFDETLHRTEDFDFNQRIRRSGKKIILIPDIVSHYYARGTLKDFWKHNFDNGRLVTAPWAQGKMNFAVRHLTPLGAVIAMGILTIGAFFVPNCAAVLMGLIALYFSADFYFSLKAVMRKKNIAYLPLMFFMYPFLHVSYGFGSIKGLMQVLRGAFIRNKYT